MVLVYSATTSTYAVSMSDNATSRVVTFTVQAAQAHPAMASTTHARAHGEGEPVSPDSQVCPSTEDEVSARQAP